MNCLYFNVNTFGIPMCAQPPVTYSLWEGPEDDWITVETCSPIVISENKCCADVKNCSIYRKAYSENPACWNWYFFTAVGLSPGGSGSCAWEVRGSKVIRIHIVPELLQANVGIIPDVRPRPLSSQFVPSFFPSSKCAYKLPENVPHKSAGALTPDDGLSMSDSTYLIIIGGVLRSGREINGI